ARERRKAHPPGPRGGGEKSRAPPPPPPIARACEHRRPRRRSSVRGPCLLPSHGCRDGLAHVVAQLLRPPVVDPAIVVPLVSELGQHIAGEEVDILQCQLMWHRADLKQHHQIPNAQFLDDLLPKTITYGRRASCDHVAPLHEVAITK